MLALQLPKKEREKKRLIPLDADPQSGFRETSNDGECSDALPQGRMLFGDQPGAGTSSSRSCPNLKNKKKKYTVFHGTEKEMHFSVHGMENMQMSASDGSVPLL